MFQEISYWPAGGAFGEAYAVSRLKNNGNVHSLCQ